MSSIDTTFPFEQLREQPLALRGAMAALATAFGGIALLLTIVGIYGTMTNAVSQRSREIACGWHSALLPRTCSDRPGRVAAHDTRNSRRLALAAAVARLVTSELFGVAPTDPLTRVLPSRSGYYFSFVASRYRYWWGVSALQRSRDPIYQSYIFNNLNHKKTS